MQELITIKYINLKINSIFFRYKFLKSIWCYLRNFDKVLMKI
jgi:hypothetical protein